jgi:hypothetical protein
VAQRPRYGGHTWVFLNYLLGFKDLGWEVLLLDRLEPEMCFDREGRPCAVEDSLNLQFLEAVMKRFELTDSYSLLYDDGARFIGLPLSEVNSRLESSAVFLNVNGFITDAELLDRAPLRAFLDIDPGYPQMWSELGLDDPFRHHNAFVTVGENVGSSGCTIPTCGLKWITTPQPVVLALWPGQPPRGKAFTSVATWRGPYGPIDYRGQTYGLRVHEWRKLAELPSLVPHSFEIALEIDSSDAHDIALLRENGWRLVDPRSVAGDPWAYQEYVRGSKAEFMVAKNMYVRARSGWFSDRSICYLASGRPVLAQDTGFTQRYPTGEGLLAYTNLDQARDGVEDISRHYQTHVRSARALAEEYFDSKKVLDRLLSRLGVG